MATVDAAVACHDAVSIGLEPLEPEVGRPVRHEPVELHEAAFVEENVEAFAGGELAFVVLRLDSRRSAALLGFGASLIEQLQLIAHGHGRGK